MSFKKAFLCIFLLFLLLPASGCVKSKPANNLKVEPAGNQQPAASAPKTSPRDLEKQYESALKNILLPYWQNQQPAGIKEKILELRAPAKYLDLHLNLVIAFEQIEQGQQSSDQDEIETGMDKIEALKIKYPWLQ